MNEIKKIDVGLQTRFATFKRQEIDKEARTVPLAFSSEEPVARWDGFEILDHSPESIRLDRLIDGGPVLVDHDPADHVGVVESVSIDSDRRGRAVVRFGNSARATEIFNDVVDGIRKSISVGYRVYKAMTEENGTESPTYRVVDWEPLELSFVAIPADSSVKVGRDTDSKPNQLTIEVKTMPKEEAKVEVAAPEFDIKKIQAEARAEEQTRIRDISEMGEKLDVQDLARKMIENGAPVDEFMREAIKQTKRAVIEKREEEARPVQADIGIPENDLSNYSLMRAVWAAANNDWSKAGFEREVNQAAADTYGREANGFWVPPEVFARDMTTASGGTGLKGTVTTGFIDKLYDNALGIRLGADVLTGLVGDVSVPALTAGGTAYWVAEDGDITDGDATVGAVTLDPKTVGFAVPISRLLRRQSTPSIDRVIETNLMREMGLAIDDVLMEGGGANQPTGIAATSGVPTSTIASAGSPTRAELLEFETDVAAGNGLNGSLAFVTTSAVRGNMKGTAIDSGSGLFLCSDNNEAVGYRVYVANHLTANRIIFGNFNDVYLGMWGGTDIVVDDATKAASGGIVMRAFQDLDVAVKHAASFSINA